MELKLFEAEYRLMDLIWELEPVNSTKLAKLCDATVTALVKRAAVQRAESEALMERAFGGSVPLFVATLLGGRKLTRAEAEALKKMIEEAAE